MQNFMAFGGKQAAMPLLALGCMAVLLGTEASSRAEPTPSSTEEQGEQTSKKPASEDALDKPDEEGRWAAFPVISSSPETSLMFGGVVLRHFRLPGRIHRMQNGRWPRRSSVAVFAAYSLKNQFIASLAPTLYLQGERWSVGGSMNAIFFPGIFYEIGRESRESSAEDYTQRLFSASLEVSRTVVSSLRAGLQIAVAHARITEVEAGGILESHGVEGSNGGLIVGFGPVVAWDSRDQNMATQSGSLYQVAANFYPSFIGSEYAYGVATFSARRFFAVTRDHTLALGAIGQLGWGDMPFQVMAKLGGDSNLRGYFDSRHIDIHGVVAQAEYRLPLYWKIGGASIRWPW